MNWNGFGRKRSWPILRYPGILLEGLKESSKNLSHDNRSPVRDLNPGTPGYQAGVLTSRPRYSVPYCSIFLILFIFTYVMLDSIVMVETETIY
jgi:hypothetical protein